MTHCERILDFMEKNGSITQNDATYELGCTRLAARISDLKKKGYAIDCEYETGKNRFNETTRYARYRLRGAE